MAEVQRRLRAASARHQRRLRALNRSRVRLAARARLVIQPIAGAVSGTALTRNAYTSKSLMGRLAARRPRGVRAGTCPGSADA